MEIIGLAADNDRRTQCLAEYVCELVLLQCDIGTYSQAQVAAACVLLARLLHRRGEFINCSGVCSQFTSTQ